jgi:hypothetical protein
VSRSMKIVRKLLPARRSKPDPVGTLRRALENTPEARSGFDQLSEALEAVLQGRSWETARAGQQFANFTDFAIARAPAGLGARTLPSLRLLRHLMLEGAYYDEWVCLMERTIRQRGRPKTLANGDDLVGTYPYSRTLNSRDYLLLTLKRQHPEVFANLCEAKGSIRQAAISVGIIVPPGPRELRYGVYDARAAKDLNEKAKPKLLKEFFDDVGLNAQCTFLNRLEGILGGDLARRWREHYEKQKAMH